MVAKIEVPVFVETNLGTRIAIAVSPDITAVDFKRELERAHIDSFPELGEVTSITVMVKQRSKFYCLPDLLPIKHACQGCKKVWFVYVNACLSNKLEKISALKCLIPETRASHSHVNDHLKVNKNNANIKCKKAKLKRIWCLKAVILGLVAATNATRKKTKRKRRHILKKVPIEDNVGFEPGYVVDHGQILGTEADQKEVLESDEVWGSSLSCTEIGTGIGTGTENGNSAKFRGRFGCWDVPKYPNGDVFGTGNDKCWKLPCIIGSSDTAETPCGSSSGAVSVSGIINRYFSNLVELEHINSSWSSEVATRPEQDQRLFHSPLLEDSYSVGLGNKYKRSEVGERLLMASNSLRQCRSKQSSSRSNLCKGKKFLESDAGTIARSLVFEIGDDNA